jgi:hypothetical protein
VRRVYSRPGLPRGEAPSEWTAWLSWLYLVIRTGRNRLWKSPVSKQFGQSQESQNQWRATGRSPIDRTGAPATAPPPRPYPRAAWTGRGGAPMHHGDRPTHKPGSRRGGGGGAKSKPPGGCAGSAPALSEQYRTTAARRAATTPHHRGKAVRAVLLQVRPKHPPCGFYWAAFGVRPSEAGLTLTTARVLARF